MAVPNGLGQMQIENANGAEGNENAGADPQLQILQAVTQIQDRLASIEGRLTSVEARLTSVETRLTSVETRLTTMEIGLADLYPLQHVMSVIRHHMLVQFFQFHNQQPPAP